MINASSLPFRPRKPFWPGELLGPSSAVQGNNMVLRFSVIDEHFYSAGADPQEDLKTIWKQLKAGPYDTRMFISCIALAFPGLIHLYFHQHFGDYVAGLSLILVGFSSSFCDALCVHSGIFDDGSGERRYEKTAMAIGKEPGEVQALITAKKAAPKVIAPDSWNNFSRAVDRGVCVLLVFPSLMTYVLLQRSLVQSLPYFLVFAVAWLACFRGQRYRLKNPVGFKVIEGARHIEGSFRCYMIWHELWHLLLFVTFIINALDRRNRFS